MTDISRSSREEITTSDIFFAGCGMATLFVQVPITKMIFDDPQALYLGSWDMATFSLFSGITFLGVPVVLGLIFSLVFGIVNRLGFFLLVSTTSYLITRQIYFHYVHFYYTQAAWRSYAGLGMFMLSLVLVWYFRRSIVQMLKVCGVFSLAVFALFAYYMAPFDIASSSASVVTPVATTNRNDNLVFFLTFEKLVASYVTDANGQILVDRFPNLARFVANADFYPNTYANATGTSYSLKTLYSGRLQLAIDRGWTRHPHLRDILGADRKVFMLLDLLDYCKSAHATCVRSVGTEGMRGLDIIIGWYKTYGLVILPGPLQEKLSLLGWHFDPWYDMWAIEEANLDPSELPQVKVGTRQFRNLADIVKKEGRAPHLYIMHNFISDGPATKTSGLQERTESDYLQDLEVARANLAAFEQQLGEFLDVLEEVGVYDQSLILITSDTGYDPQSRHVRVKGDQEIPASAEMLRVFLAIKRPGQREGRVIPSVFRQIDVLPTILEDLGMDPEVYEFEGVPVTDPKDMTNLAQRPVEFMISSDRAGVLYYRLTDPAGPLRRMGKW